jgi:hypothetical protein
MLRLDLKDNHKTVLFIDPMKDINISINNKESCYELHIETNSDVCFAVYESEEDRDAAYEYVLNKINEDLFPQKESAQSKNIHGIERMTFGSYDI